MIGMTVCSGIGAPEVAAPWIDWKYQSEIDAFPSAVLAHRFPNAVNLGDMTKFKEWPDAEIDILCGGTPCQAFSVAGLRQGLADPRGQLTLTYLAIAERYKPRWLVWENVPGALSVDGGRAFGSLLGGMAELGYGWAYRVLDAQYTRTRSFPRAVPQRRRRVFVVGYLGDWRRAAAVLFDGESLRGNPPPRREAGQVAPTVPSRSSAGGGLGTDFDCDGGLIAETAAALTTKTGTGLSVYDAEGGNMIAAPVASCLNAAFGNKQGLEDQHINQGAPLFVAHALRGELRTSDISPQLTTGGGKPDEGYPAVMTPWAVRRLTPRECSRLMGFPDDWARIPYRGKPADQCPDGPQYKAYGNSWAVNCGQVIFDRIRIVEGMSDLTTDEDIFA